MSTRPIQARLVQQIQVGRFVKMWDLLWDNSAVRRHYEDMHGAMGVQVLPVSSRPRVHEVTTPPSWICCFLTFLAVGTSDQVTQDRITYAMLVVREALRQGGQGWLDYDRLFRQLVALNPDLQWNVIHPELQAITLLGQCSTGPGIFCTLYQECDHTASQCVIAQLQQPTVRGTPNAPRTTSRYG